MLDELQMYEELVKRIRGCSYSDPNGCEECRDCPNAENYYECKQKLALQAADAIEELGRVADAIPHVCECCIGCEVETGGCDRAFVLSPKRAREYLSKPRWIPVTEQKPPLPEDEDVCYVHVIAAVNGRKEVEPVLYSRAYRLRDGKRVRIERFIGDGEVLDVTHWMPLPQPPKENGKSET